TRPALAIGVGEPLLLVTLLGRGSRVPPQELDATALVPQVDEIPTRIRTAGHTKRESRTGVVPIDDADMALGKPLAEFRLHVRQRLIQPAILSAGGVDAHTHQIP